MNFGSVSAEARTTVYPDGLLPGALVEAWLLGEPTNDHSLDDLHEFPVPVVVESILDGQFDIVAEPPIGEEVATGAYRVGYVWVNKPDFFEGRSWLSADDDGSGFQTSAAPCALMFDGVGAIRDFTLLFWAAYTPDEADPPKFIQANAYSDGPGSVSVSLQRGSVSEPVSLYLTGATPAPTSIIPSDRAHLVAVVGTSASGGRLRAYVDGVLIADTGPGAGPISGGSGTGAYFEANIPVFNYPPNRGRVHNLAVFDYAMSAENLLALVSAEWRHDLREYTRDGTNMYTGGASGPRHWWPCDGDTSTATDRGMTGGADLTPMGSATIEHEQGI